MIDRMDMH
jgi:hypothetical protein